MKNYGGFCPISKAAEVFAERWTPLIIRELMAGSSRFKELEFGIPGIPTAILAQRLRSLQAAGVVMRVPGPGPARNEYHLTESGAELGEIVIALGRWGQRWVNHGITAEDIDPALLMWDMRRRINFDRVPDRRVIIQFDFVGACQRSFWLVLEKTTASVCLQDPGFEIDLLVTADTVTLHRIWMGEMELGAGLRRGLISPQGPRELVRAFPSWLALNLFAATAGRAPERREAR